MNHEILLLVVGAAVAGFVQGISGFAFAMVAVSIWAWGIDPRVAGVVAVFGGLSGQILSAITVRRGLHFSLLAPFLVGAAAGVPVGVLAVRYLDPGAFRLALGVILAVFSLAMLNASRLPPIRAGGRVGDAVAGAIGGFMGAFGGFTGVVPALWCTLRGFSKDEHRALVQNFNLAALAATMTALTVSGAVHREMLPRFAVVLPALVLPSMVGSRVYLGLSVTAFRRIVLSLLFLSGVAMVWTSL